MVVPTPKRRWFFPTPDWLVIGSLAVTGLLFLSERYRWFWFNEKKGWTVLLAVASVGVMLLLMAVWFVEALGMRCRFQFSLRSPIVPVVLVLGNLAPLCAEEPKAPQTNQITNSIGMKLTLVPAGEFHMGGEESAEATAEFVSKTNGENLRNADYFKNEHPRHRVRITKPFYLGTYHVTRGQFRQFVADTHYHTDSELIATHCVLGDPTSPAFKAAAAKVQRPGAWAWNSDSNKFVFDEKYSWRNAGFEQTDEHPVVNVSWNDAAAFCKWLSKKESKTYRLPTEAEWEYACRAGTTTRFYSGDDPQTLAKVGNVADVAYKAKFPDQKYTMRASDGFVFTAPVGKFKPNAFGLYDMHGNVWQWCADRYGAEYYTASPVDDPTGPESGDSRVRRGGSWYSGPFLARSAKRLGDSPDFRFMVIGFRVARTQ